MSKSRVSQYIKAGMPVRADALVDADAAAAWVAQNIDPGRAGVLRQAPRPMFQPGTMVPVIDQVLAPPLPFAWTIRAALRGCYGAALEHGLEHAQAARIATLAALALWDAVEQVHGLQDQLTMEAADFALPPA